MTKTFLEQMLSRDSAYGVVIGHNLGQAWICHGRGDQDGWDSGNFQVIHDLLNPTVQDNTVAIPVSHSFVGSGSPERIDKELPMAYLLGIFDYTFNNIATIRPGGIDQYGDIFRTSQDHFSL